MELELKEENFPCPEMALSEWLWYWFESYIRRSLKQSTAVSYRGHIKNHIEPEIGNIPLCKLGTLDLRKFYNNLYDGTCINQKKLSPKTIKNIHLTISAALGDAVDCGLISSNVCKGIVLPKKAEKEMRVLNLSEQAAIHKAALSSNEPFHFGVYLSLMTGMRLGEVLGLQWRDINNEKCTISVRRTVNRLQTLDGKGKTERVVDSPKSKSSIRDIPIDNDTIRLFERHKIILGETLSVSDFKRTDFVFSSTYPYPAEPKTMQKKFSQLASSEGIEDVHFHCLRHTFATRAIEGGMDVKTLSVLLGHANVETTLKRYVHVLEKHKREAMETFLANQRLSTQMYKG